MWLVSGCKVLAGFQSVPGALRWLLLLVPLAAMALAPCAPSAAQRKEPDRPPGCYLAGGAHALNAGNLNQAEKVFRAALQAYPGFNEAREDLGITLAREGQFDAAAGEFRKVLSVRPDLAEAHYNLGLTLIRQQNGRAALVEFRTAVRLRPDYPEAHNSIGLLLQKQHDPAGASDEFRLAVRLEPHDADALNG
ncbi:MAG: tetratricopeptide repeat protein, partial [Terriglobia bacterium]